MKNVLLEELERCGEISASTSHSYASFLKEKFGVDENGDLKDFDLNKLTKEELEEYKAKKMSLDSYKAKRYALSKLLDDNIDGGRGDNTVLIKPTFYDVDTTYSIITEAIDKESGSEIVSIGGQSITLPADLKEKPIDEQLQYYQDLVKKQAVKDINGAYSKESEFKNICNETYDALPKVDKKVYYKQKFNEFIEKINKFTIKIQEKIKGKDKSDDSMGLQAMTYTDEEFSKNIASSQEIQDIPEKSDDFVI